MFSIHLTGGTNLIGTWSNNQKADSTKPNMTAVGGYFTASQHFTRIAIFNVTPSGTLSLYSTNTTPISQLGHNNGSTHAAIQNATYIDAIYGFAAKGAKGDKGDPGPLVYNGSPMDKWIVESGQFTGAVTGHLSTTLVWDYNKYNNGTTEATAKFDLGTVTLPYTAATGTVFRLNSTAYYFDFQLAEKFATVDHMIVTGKNNGWSGPISQYVQTIGPASCRIFPTLLNNAITSLNIFYLQLKGTWR